MAKLCLVLVLLLFVFSIAQAKKIDDRVIQMLNNMTLEEKVGQMTQLGIHQVLLPGGEVNVPLLRRMVKEYHIGSFLQAPNTQGGGPNLKIEEWIKLITDVQQVFIEEGEIPMMYGIDSVHGSVFVDGATYFPQQLGLAATFNRELVKQVGSITAKDTRLVGIPWAFSPILDLATEPRWARVYETFGEDPYVAGELGVAMIQGYQGFPANLSSEVKVAACMKHFIAYGEPRTGRDRNPTWIPERYLYEYFVPPFQAVVDAGVATAMESYNDVNGEPVCASKRYLKTLLRDEMGFEGMLVTDWAEIRDLSRFHKIAETEKDATRISIERTTIDMSMVAIGPTFWHHLVELVNEGAIPESRLDESVARILQLKTDLGLFERPIPDPNSPLLETIGGPEDRQTALNICHESITLLENQDNFLPLDASKLTRVFLVGPSSDSLKYQCGGWTVMWQGAPDDSYFAFGSTILDGVNTYAEDFEVVQRRGCGIDGSFEENELEEAIAEAEKSDVVILAIGEDTYAERFGDIHELRLPAGQLELTRALIATGVPVVVVLLEGRPRTLEGATDNAKAVLHAYLPGLEGGQAIADIIFGAVNPSGKIPLSYPKYDGAGPLTYYRKVTEEANFQWEFGTGLSYTTFRYSNLELSASTISPSDTLQVSVTVTNNGEREGKETVFLYLTDVVREITPEVKRLRRFEKVNLQPSEEITLTFELTIDDLSFYGIDVEKIYEAGEFIVSIGRLSASFHLVV